MIRKATIADIEEIFKLINYFADKGWMLSRSLYELYETIRDFFVYVKNKKIIGVGALHISWKDLAEVRSLAIKEAEQKKGIGGKILKACLEEAKNFKIKKIFTLTYIPQFFEKYGFKKIEKEKLPRKVWSECIKCVKFPHCNEIPLIFTFKNFY